MESRASPPDRLVRPWKAGHVSLRLAAVAGGDAPAFPLAMYSRTALRGKTPVGNCAGHPQPPFVAVDTALAFQDIVTKYLKTGSFAQIVTNPAARGADFGEQTEASFPLDKVRSTCCSF
jgi:hypothetical protein